MPDLRDVICECACNQCGEYLFPGEKAYGFDDTDGSIVWYCTMHCYNQSNGDECAEPCEFCEDNQVP
jgi:hypothetical protein